jgi:hypothetical protein
VCVGCWGPSSDAEPPRIKVHHSWSAIDAFEPIKLKMGLRFYLFIFNREEFHEDDFALTLLSFWKIIKNVDHPHPHPHYSLFQIRSKGGVYPFATVLYNYNLGLPKFGIC